MGTIYVQTTGSSTNSGTSDNNAADVTLTVDASYAGSGTTIPVVVNTGSLTTSVNTTVGLSQSAVQFPAATNSNRKIFWITAFNDASTPKTITVDVAPTGLTAGSSTGSIGGRYVWPSGSTVSVIDGAMGASGGQDIVQFNDTPAVRTGAYFVLRNAATAASGFITVQGKSGGMPVLQVTGTYIFNANVLAGLKVANLELKNLTSGGIVQNATGMVWFDGIKVSACTGAGIAPSSTFRLTNSEITGCASDGVAPSAASCVIAGNYIHGNGGAGVNVSSTSPTNTIVDNLIVGNTGKGIYFSGSPTTSTNCALIAGNTIADNGDSQIEVANAFSDLTIRNNIIRASAAGVATIKWAAGNSELFCNHKNNVIWQSNSSTSGVTNYTLDSTESASDPQFVNSAGGNYAIANASSAAGAGYPGTLPGIATSVGYRDIGAFQRQVTAGGNGVITG